MAVRASATITLNSVVDIKATYRYYLLQSSTASKPAKPTANPPGGSWTDAEPTYTSGSTNSLYFVDLTIFSDDSFSYSEVSRSTSYEAAKEAYNKATNAQSSVDNLKVGGRNLFRNTAKMPIVSKFTDGTGVSLFSAGVGTLTDTGEGIKLTYDSSGRGAMAIPLTYDGAVDNNETVTLSFKYRGTMASVCTHYFLARTTPNVVIRDFPAYRASDTEWLEYKYTFSNAEVNDRICYSVLLAYNPGSSWAGTWIEFKKGSLKLEHGNKATDWSPAPEDTDAEIEQASKVAKNFMSYDSTNGLEVGDKSNGSWSGFRTQIKSNVFNILNAAGVVVASYGEKLIELGKNATDAIIKLCGGKGQIEYVTDEDNNTEYVQMSSDRVRVKSSKMSSVYSMYTDNSTRWEKSSVNVTPTKVEIYASECIDPALPEHVDGWHTTQVDIESGKVDVTTPGPVTFNCEGVYDDHGKLMSAIHGSSGIWNYSKWSNGTVELWGVHSVSNKACTAALGSMYRTDALSIDTFPFEVRNPKLTASYESSGYGAMLWATSETSTSRPPSYYLIRPTSGTIASGKIIFHVTGTWA